MSLPNTADVVIIGGGVMGASIAYHLANAGMRDILLLEKDDFFGQGATGRCAGGVRYQFATEVNVRLSLASLPMLERFEEEIGQAIDYRKCGYLFVLTQPADVSIFQSTLTMQNRLGAGTFWLDGDDIRQRLPMMGLEDAIGGTFNPKDGTVDPNSVVMGYIRAGQRLGVNALTGVEVTGIQTGGGCVRAVESNQGIISTPVIVNAAGPWASLVADKAGLTVPTALGKGCMVAMATRLVHTVLNRCKHPSDGDIFVPIGTVTVLGTTDIPVGSPEDLAIEPEEIDLLLAEGEILIPSLLQHRPLRAWAGIRPLYRPATEPVIADPGCGHHRLIQRVTAVHDRRIRHERCCEGPIEAAELRPLRHQAHGVSGDDGLERRADDPQAGHELGGALPRGSHRVVGDDDRARIQEQSHDLE